MANKWLTVMRFFITGLFFDCSTVGGQVPFPLMKNYELKLGR